MKDKVAFINYEKIVYLFMGADFLLLLLFSNLLLPIFFCNNYYDFFYLIDNIFLIIFDIAIVEKSLKVIKKELVEWVVLYVF